MKGSIRFNDAVNAEVTTDGTDITKVVNVATGEEYGGGGGGDFSTAEVTITNSTGGILDLYFPFIDENGVLQLMFSLNDDEIKIIKTPIAENGAYYSTSIAEANVTGNVQFIQEETAVLITGDGTLEVILID